MRKKMLIKLDTVAQLNVILVKGFKKLNTHFEEFSYN